MDHIFCDTKQPNGDFEYQCVLCKHVSTARRCVKFDGCPRHASHWFSAVTFEHQDARTAHVCRGCGCDSASSEAQAVCPKPYKPETSSGGRAHWLDYAMELGM